MSTLLKRHYSQKIIARNYVECIKIQQVKALYMYYVVYLISLLKWKIQHKYSRTVSKYWKFSFIVVKDNQNQNLILVNY